MITVRRTISLVLAIFSAASCAVAQSQIHREWSVQGEPLADVLENVSGAAVFIQTEEASGSGFYATLEGDVVTALHVVTLENGQAAKHISLVSKTSAAMVRGLKLERMTAKLDAHIIAKDSEHDLAVLRPEYNPFHSFNNKLMKTVHPAVLCKRGFRLRSGDPVFTLGHPLGDPRVIVTRGIIASAEPLQFDSTGTPNLSYYVDMVINHGNSGGPVFTSTGCVLGVAEAVKLAHVEGVVPGLPPQGEVLLPLAGPDGKPLMQDGKPVTMELNYSSGLGILVSQTYILKMLDSAGYKSAAPSTDK